MRTQTATEPTRDKWHVPNAWRRVRAGEICTLEGESIDPQRHPDTTFAHYSIPAFDAGQVPVIEKGGAILSTKTRFQRGSVLFSKLNPRIPRVWCVEDEHPYPRICSTEFLPLRVDPKVVDPAFLAFALQEPETLRALRAGVAAATKSRERLRPEQVLAAEVALPPLTVQRRLVSMLREYLAAVERARGAVEAQIEAGAALAGAQLRATFRGAAAATWPRVPLRQLLTRPLRTGLSRPADPAGNIPCLTLSAVRSGRLDLSATKLVAMRENEVAANRITPGAFYVVRGNGQIRLVGRGALAPDVIKDPVAFPDLLIEVRTEASLVEPRFLRWAWDAEEVRSDIEARARTSAGIYKINLATLSEVRLPIPPLDEQVTIARELDRAAERAQKLLAALEGQLDAIAGLPHALLQQAFNGAL